MVWRRSVPLSSHTKELSVLSPSIYCRWWRIDMQRMRSSLYISTKVGIPSTQKKALGVRLRTIVHIIFIQTYTCMYDIQRCTRHSWNTSLHHIDRSIPFIVYFPGGFFLDVVMDFLTDSVWWVCRFSTHICFLHTYSKNLVKKETCCYNFPKLLCSNFF